MNGFKDAFISYGRKDSKAFVTHLHQRLVAEGLSIWFDFDDIPLGVDFQNQIDDGIETSHNFLFVIAPHSVNSPYCLKEIELALRHHKRIIPLLHVEEIDYDTWRDRNPSASDDEWETYRAQGLHTSFINMHPEIAKINWVYFREGVDDFEAGFAGLLETMGRQQDYVHQHTHLLQDALSWERQQRQMSALLSQAEARQAYSWLTTTFAGEQPPCAPTTLQGEFITESLKQASGGMTQVFLSYSEENRPQREEIHRLLQRQGFTVWVNTTDIQTGSDFEQAIRDGVEKADSVVYLLSPSSLTSRYCQQELEFAQSYNKRIIPLLIHDIDEVAVPEFLRVLQFIDFRPDGVLSREQGLERLLQVLQEDADYYDCHKRLLVKALIWERHRRRKRYLLRGNAFVEAETWLTASRHQTAMPPTRLHEVFIEASQDINRYFDAFISYGRADSLQFAVWVQDQLSQQGLSVWLDKNDIPVGVDFQTQIDDGISKAHNVIFIISPHSANSPYCLKELELALRYNKRIIPVMQMERIGYDTWRQRNPGGSAEDWATYQAEGRHLAHPNLHPEVRKLNWLFCREGVDDPQAAIASLVEQLRHQEQLVHLHTELLLKALNWESHQRQSEYLLIGNDRREAEAWLTAETEDQPAYYPTDLQCSFIAASIKQVDGTTQAFLCVADDYVGLDDTVDGSKFATAIAMPLRRTLQRAGITVWNPQTDVEPGENLQGAIERGVEETDNVVFVLSAEALKSALCLSILNRALQLNKRIIPVMPEGTEALKLPPVLKSLQPIHLAQDGQVLRAAGVEQLIGALQQDKAYYRTHKLLLRKALKWERQKQNPSILLRGNELRRMATWLDVSQGHLHPPTALQTQYVRESAKQPPDQTVDVLLTYASEDIEFARRLNQTLQVQSKTTWFAQDQTADVADTADLQQAIENAENMVVVLSPSLAETSACLEQLAHAASLNKRIIPVLHQEVLISKLPPAVEQQQAIDFRAHSGDFLTNFGELYRAIESEPQHMRQHTRLLVKAKEWEDAERDDSYLLLGRDREASIQWLTEAQTKSPPPTDLHREYVQASQQLPFRRIKRRWVALSSLAAAIAVGALRLFGAFEGVELLAFDHLLRLRPSEPLDEHLLMVAVDQDSNTWLRQRTIDGEFEPGLGTVPDEAMAEAIAYLNDNGARLIGVDFYRDFPAKPVLSEQFAQSNVVGICEAGDDFGDGFTAPTEIPIERVGFNDLLEDGGSRVRRHYLKQEADPQFCDTENSITLELARRYLVAEGQNYTEPWQRDDIVNMALGEAEVPELYQGHSAAYPVFWSRPEANPEAVNGRGGYQTMLNFRAVNGSAIEFAPTVTLQEVLTQAVSAEAIEGRIVIIGYSDSSDRNTDSFNTAYGSMPGFVLHGQMTSQLVGAALDDRPLIRWLSTEFNLLWIGGWAAVGGMVFWGFVRPSRQLPASAVALAALYGTCYAALAASGLWLPLAPAAIAYALTGAGVAGLSYRVRHPS